MKNKIDNLNYCEKNKEASWLFCKQNGLDLSIRSVHIADFK